MTFKSQFKVGDRVTVLDTESNRCNATLKGFLGKVVTVRRVDGDDFVSFNEILDLSPAPSGAWAQSRFALVPKPALKAGDKVVIDMDAQRNKGGLYGYSMLRDRTLTVNDTKTSFGEPHISIVGESTHGWIYADRFKLAPVVKVEDAPCAEWIVMLKETGKYAPAPAPRVYSSELQAITVAAKMAEKHSGNFVVFKSVADANMPVVVPVSASVRTFI